MREEKFLALLQYRVAIPLYACKDAQGRLMVGAAVGTGNTGVERVEAMMDAGLDVVVVDTAHGHSKNVLETVARIRKLASKDLQVIAGNIATGDPPRH